RLADMILFAVAFLAVRIFWSARIWLRSRRWIVVHRAFSSVDRPKRLMVYPAPVSFPHCLESAQFSFTRSCVERGWLPLYLAAAFTHCRQSAQFSLACRWSTHNRS